MDNNGGKSAEDRQRETTSEIMREKVFAAYSDNPPKVTEESWRKYHSAWQDYYQKYYSDFYSKAAKDFVAKEKLKIELEKAEAEAVLREKVSKKASDEAREQKKTEKRRRKWTPILAGASVMLAILFLQYNRLIFAPIMAYISPGENPASGIEAVDPIVSNDKVSAESKLIIPKINVDVPVQFGIKLDEVNTAMRTGVAHYRVAGASAFPGEIGNTVITGHSAGDVYNNDPYKYIFSGLERLGQGDLIYVNYKSKRYTYRVTEMKTVEPTDVDQIIIETDKPILTLITCTPLGTSRYRLLVFAEQIAPDYKNAPSAEPTVVPEEIKEVMPANEDTFFSRICKWIIGKSE